jgi:hypothetical protein
MQKMTQLSNTVNSTELDSNDIDEGFRRFFTKHPIYEDFYWDAEALIDVLDGMDPEKHKGMFGLSKSVPVEDDLFVSCWISGFGTHEEFQNKRKKESLTLLESYRKKILDAIRSGEIKHALGGEILFYKEKVIFLTSLISYGSWGAPFFKSMPLADMAVNFMYGEDIKIPSEQWAPVDNNPWYPGVKYDFIDLTNNKGDRYLTRVNPAFFKALLDFRSVISDVHLEKYKKEVNRRWVASLVKFPIDDNSNLKLNPTTDLEEILNKNQLQISQIKPELVKNFVQLFSFLRGRKKYLENLFNASNDQKFPEQIDYLITLLDDEVEKYNLMLWNALRMLTAASENDLVIFYQFYEFFDKYSVFDSNWEKNMTAELKGLRSDVVRMEMTVNANLWMMSSQIRSLESSMVDGMSALVDATSAGFDRLNESVNNQLGRVNSTLNYIIPKR